MTTQFWDVPYSNDAERQVPRFIPVEGKRKSPPKDQAHKGKNGTMLRVYITKSTREVRKGNPSNWTDEANAKFAEMYCDGDINATVGQDFGNEKKKKTIEQYQLEALQAKLAAAESAREAAESKQTCRELRVCLKTKIIEINKKIASLTKERQIYEKWLNM